MHEDPAVVYIVMLTMTFSLQACCMMLLTIYHDFEALKNYIVFLVSLNMQTYNPPIPWTDIFGGYFSGVIF